MILPKRRKPPKMGLREPSKIRCTGHLRWIRQHFCAVKNVNGHVCRGRIEAAHVRSGTDGGVGRKPSDIWAIPLCASAHRDQHSVGEARFERAFGIDMKAIAEGLARISPALKKRAKALGLVQEG